MNITASVGGKSREKWLRGFARIGLGAHGIVYCLMSLLSMMAALGFKKESAGKTEAMKTIYEQPFGRVVLFVIGAAMLGYVLLRFFQAFKDTRHQGKGMKGLALRCSYFFIGLFYLSLSYACINLAFYKSSDSEGKRLLISRAMEYDWGVYLIGAIGLGFIGGGIYQVWRGVSKAFMKVVDLRYSEFKRTFERIGIVGHVARGLVFGIIGYLFVRAAIDANPRKAKDTEGAFDFVRANFGNWVMAVIALGLFAYGIFMLVRAKHEKMSFDQK